MKKNIKKRKKGFTLIELIIVIAIIAILAAIAIPKFATIRKNANITTDIANAKNIHSIVAQGIADEKIELPDDETGYALNEVGKQATKYDVTANLEAGGKTSKIKNVDFKVYLDNSGNITIYAGDKPANGNDNEVYPKQGKDFEKK